MPERPSHCNDFFYAISDPVRRSVLRYLDRDGPKTLGSVATHVGVGSTSLRHAHLPTLADANCVRYTDAKTVTDRVVSITAVGETAVNVLNEVPDCYDC